MEEDEKDEVLSKFDRQFREYVEDNPGANFGDFYVQQAADSIARNEGDRL